MLMNLDLKALDFLTAVSSEPMASEHWHHPTNWGTGSDVFAESFYEEPVDEVYDVQTEEDQVLVSLLEAFPGISLESLAAAYARAERDPNLAAEILSVETCKEPEARVEKLERHGHGDFAGGSVWGDSPILGNHSRPPDSSSDAVADNPSHFCNEDNAYPLLTRNRLRGNNSRPPESSSDAVADNISHFCNEDNAYPLLTRNRLRGYNKLSANAPIYEFQGTNLLRGIVSASFPAPKSDNLNGNQNGVASDSSLQLFKSGALSGSIQKQSAVTGSVSNQRQRRTDTFNESLSRGAERELELEQGLYSGKARKKKKKLGAENGGEKLGPVDIEIRRAAEDFLHSMLGGDIGIDVVRDVLGHFEGDTDKALETLLHIGSTSAGFNYGGDPEKDALDIGRDGPGSDLTNHPSFIDRFLGNDDANKAVLSQLHDSFPSVDVSFLAVVLEAADFSYGGAVNILQESGMSPVNKQMQEKLDPAEVLQALFRTDTEPPEGAGLSRGPQVSTESWSVVAAKAQVQHTPTVQMATERLTSEANGEWNEYARHRSSANEHWVTMKRYMKEAAAAYHRGDRALAGVLSQKGSKFKQLAHEASNRASQNIFNVKNKDIENNITIDLHAQHVKESLQLIKLHLRTLSQISSVHRLTLITGQGSHSTGGHAKIKPALKKYLERRQIPWTEPNAGCILIKMSDVRVLEASQRSSDSSSDNDSY